MLGTGVKVILLSSYLQGPGRPLCLRVVRMGQLQRQNGQGFNRVATGIKAILLRPGKVVGLGTREGVN